MNDNSNQYAELYGEYDRHIMKTAEDSLDRKADRVNELILFAKEAGIKIIGIANCVAFEKEAAALEHRLIAEGFQVVRANCKLGRMSRSEILPDYSGLTCNPAGQAQYLSEGKSELNLVLGLCVGHDMVFQLKSNVITSTLLVKDRKNAHQPLVALRDMQND